MQILLTGGAGYIGSVIMELLLENNETVIVLDDLSEGNPQAIPNEVEFYEGDFSDIRILQSIIKNHSIDVVIHLAAFASVPDSVLKPLDYYENNVVKTIHLLKMMQQFGVNKMIFSSTAAVYGVSKSEVITEESDTRPVNPYGWSKLMIERVLQDLNVTNGFKSMSFRYFCAAGATERHGESRKKGETHLIPLVVDSATNQNDILKVFGNDFPTRDGTGVRDYIHVLDIAQAHIFALHAIEECQSEIFNLGSGKGYSVLEVIKTARKVLNLDIAYKIVDRRMGDPPCLIASSRKARSKLGWEPKLGLDEMIKSTFHWRNGPLY